MGAIFISYTGRDPEGEAWADQLVAWCKEWNYGCFRDKDHSCGIKAGDDWRAELYQQLRLAQVLVCLVSRSYESSAWCVGEVAIAVEKGKTVIPIHLLDTEAELKTKPLPLLLQDRQAILVARAVDPSAEQLAAVKHRLRQSLDTMLNWRHLQPWDASQAPYPGLPAFEAHQAPVFFGRDKAIEKVVERLAGLALRPEAFLLLLGASGYGKSSLVRAGVVPRLRGAADKGWTVLPPFTPGDEPFKELEEAVEEAGGVFHSSDPLKSLKELRSKTKAPVVLVIDQFEELLTAGAKEDGKEDQGEVFQRFLLQLLRARKAGLMVLATMRTDYLAPLQTRWPALTGMASTYTLEPIEPEDFGALITGPADRSSLTLEAGLEARLVKESGGRDALPLLAFTLEKLWIAKEGQMLTLKAYADLGGVEGAVSTRAAECWNPQTSTDEVRQALRQAFLEHLVSVGSDGREAKRPALLAELPIDSREIVQRMVDDRLLVQKDGIVEIAHEALLRTWEPLVRWIEEDKEQLLQCLRVKRLSDDLKPEAPERQRRQALEQLAAMAAAGGSEARAVQKEGTTPLSELLKADTCPPADREDAALVLALIGAEEPLRVCLANEKAPVALRRRAAESLGLLARRCGEKRQREQIAEELERWLRSEPLNLLVEGEAGWAEHDRLLPLLQGASRGLQLAVSADLPQLGDGPGMQLPILVLTAHEGSYGLRIRTTVEKVSVWKVPLPENEWLEVVHVPDGIHELGSHCNEEGRNKYELPPTLINKEDPEARQTVDMPAFYIMRYPLTQHQWRVVARLCHNEKSLVEVPWKAEPSSMPERYGYVGMMAVESVNWFDALEYVTTLTSWLAENMDMRSLNVSIPNDCQWEIACRASTNTPFHFGDTLDSSWARFRSDKGNFGIGRGGPSYKKVGIVGESGLFNLYGVSDMHGQVAEWCDEYNSVTASSQTTYTDVGKSFPIDSARAGSTVTPEDYRLSLGGCFLYKPVYARSACKLRQRCGFDGTDVGIRLVIKLTQ